MKITAVLIIDDVAKSLAFWKERMGFQMTVSVPEGDGIGFAILERDGAELMLQSLSSARHDAPQLAAGSQKSSIFIEVGNFEDVLKRIEGYPIALEERKTFYGMREIGVTEPGGHTVIFAARV